MPKTEAQKRANRKWDAANMSMIGVSVKTTVRDAFREACEQNGTTMSSVLGVAAKQYIAAHTDSPAPLPLPTGWEQTAPSVLRTLRTPDGWQLDVDDDGTAYGAWLTHSSCSVKAFLAGANKSKHTIDEFTSLILNDIDAYKADYRHEYM